MDKFISNSYKKTAKIAQKLAKSCKIGDVLLLFGDLGAGKTAFVKGFAKEFGKAQVTSPTFTIINTYDGKIPIYHFDLYRLASESELEEIGFSEYIYGNGICVIEWPQVAVGLLPKNVIKVTINKLGETKREIIVEREDESFNN